MANKSSLREIDFAAVSPFADQRTEIETTLTDLCGAFSRERVCQALVELGLVKEQQTNVGTYETLRAYSALLIRSHKPKLVAHLVANLAGYYYGAGNATNLEQIARHHGLSKQALSKRMALIAADLKLPRPMPPNKRAIYRLMNRRNYRS